MGTLFVYILKTSLCLAFFYLFYRLLLSKETFHRFNRIALLSVLALSWLLPLITFTIHKPSEVTQAMLSIEQLLLVADFSETTFDSQIESSMINDIVYQPDYYSWGIMAILFIYAAGVIFFILRHIYSLIRLHILIKSSRKEFIAGNIRLYIHDKAISPFSWMRCIVISQQDFDENGREILIHEKAHINHLHSWDLLLADISIYFQWFNPAAWLLKQELQSIHEYQADDSVLREGVDAKQYQLLLIKKAVGTRLYSMANSFNQSTLKKRITMMLKQKSSPWARLKYLYVLPLAAIAVTAFARPEISETMNEISNTKISDLVVINEISSIENVTIQEDESQKSKAIERTPDDKVYDIAAVMPSFPGGQTALNKYIVDNLKYPITNASGRVVVQFIVTKTGKKKDIKILRGINEELDAEALRLVNSMPDFIPGKNKEDEAVNVKYTFPIYFKKSDESKSISVLMKEKMLTIVDGKEITNAEMASINPADIKSISVLKEQAAIDAYGEKGLNGALIITLYGADENRETSLNELNDNNQISIFAAENNNQLSVEPFDKNKTLIIVDGKITTHSNLNEFSPSNIESIKVLKGEKAIAEYGEKGKNGVMIITLKKDSKELNNQIEKNKTIGYEVLKTSPQLADKAISRNYYFNQKEITTTQYDELAKKAMTSNNIVLVKYDKQKNHASVYISEYSDIDDMEKSIEEKGLF